MTTNRPLPQDRLNPPPVDPGTEEKFAALENVTELRTEVKPNGEPVRHIDTPGLLKAHDSSTREAWSLRGLFRRRRRAGTGPRRLLQQLTPKPHWSNRAGRWARGAAGMWVLGVVAVAAAGALTFAVLMFLP